MNIANIIAATARLKYFADRMSAAVQVEPPDMEAINVIYSEMDLENRKVNVEINTP